jgi:cation transport regulator ChaC
LPDEALVDHIRRGRGMSGQCIDYVMSTVNHLRDMKIKDETLERLAASLDGQAATSTN